MVSPLVLLLATSPIRVGDGAVLSTEHFAREAFGNDAPWYARNIPFFECADPKIEAIYDYRWKDYKAHIRDVGERGTVITEFLDDVGWQKWPFASLNDATPFHIKEGRWLRDPRPVDETINYLYDGGGNDRHFSEGIAEATYANALARGDLARAARYLPTMRHVYNLWDDHFDFSKGLYFIEPLLDATEYTISSIDASGGKDGFRGGDAFRPTINAYQYGNARAISRLATIKGDKTTAEEFARRADALKARVQEALWSDSLTHFVDRYQVSNQFVKYWEPIRGRELAGYVPWAYEMPARRAEVRRGVASCALLLGVGRRVWPPHRRAFVRVLHAPVPVPGQEPRVPVERSLLALSDHAGPHRSRQSAERLSPDRRDEGGLPPTPAAVRGSAHRRRQAEPPGGLQSRHRKAHRGA